MNTKDKVDVLTLQLDSMARAIMAMNKRLRQLEHLKQPFMTRVWRNIRTLYKSAMENER